MRAGRCIYHALLALEEMDGEEGAGRVITALQELSAMACARGRKVGTIASSPSLSAPLVGTQSHQPLCPHAGWHQVQCTQLLQSGMRCSTGNASSPRRTLHPAPASAEGVPLLVRGHRRAHGTPVPSAPCPSPSSSACWQLPRSALAETITSTQPQSQTSTAHPGKGFASHLPRCYL